MGSYPQTRIGTILASFIGPDLRRYNGPRPFDSKILAEGWLARERELIQLCAYNGARWISPTERKGLDAVRGQTVTEYAQCWISGRNIKPRTQLHYTDLLDKHITPTLGRVPLAALTADTVNKWYSTLLTDKPTARAHTYSLLHALCGSAVEQELLIKNPCQIKRAMNTTRKREPVLLSMDELAAVADTIRPDDSKPWCCSRLGRLCDLVRQSSCGAKTSVTVAKSSRFVAV